MVEVVGNRLVERGQFGINEQVVMTGICKVRAGGRNPHVCAGQSDGHFGCDARAVFEVNEIGSCPCRRLGRTTRPWGLCQSGSARGGTNNWK